MSGAALACRRLNEVIFGSDEEAANQATFELLYAVGSESGQQRFDRQVAGRTLSAQRLADGKRVRFSVWPR